MLYYRRLACKFINRSSRTWFGHHPRYVDMTPSLSITYTFDYRISTAVIPIWKMEVELSTLAAKSALHSTKRARILYDVNPHSVFLPSADPSITAASIARRRRRLPKTLAHHRSSKSSTALTVVTDSAMGISPNDRQPTTSTTASTALIRTGEDSHQASDEPKPGGILVVRCVLVFARNEPEIQGFTVHKRISFNILISCRPFVLCTVFAFFFF